MKEHKPLMGLCPIGKFVFSNEDAVKHKKLLQEKLKKWNVRFVDLEGVLEDGLVKDQKHVGQIPTCRNPASLSTLGETIFPQSRGQP